VVGSHAKSKYAKKAQRQIDKLTRLAAKSKKPSAGAEK
jgi:hypothetical protein